MLKKYLFLLIIANFQNSSIPWYETFRTRLTSKVIKQIAHCKINSFLENNNLFIATQNRKKNCNPIKCE